MLAAIGVLLLQSCVVSPQAKPFTLDVVPAEEPVDLRYVLPNTPTLFLVSSPDQGPADGAITISAKGDGGTVADVEPTLLYPGKVVEITFIADQIETDEGFASLQITGTRNGLKSEILRSVPVYRETDQRAEEAARIRDLFLPWLVTQHPELGITAATQWKPVIVGARILVVSHYMYYNDVYEMVVSWHVMVSPYDWATVYLRKRFTETTPSFGARISSVTLGAAPVVEAPPDTVRR